jgi:hypothetical protein
MSDGVHSLLYSSVMLVSSWATDSDCGTLCVTHKNLFGSVIVNRRVRNMADQLFDQTIGWVLSARPHMCKTILAVVNLEGECKTRQGWRGTKHIRTSSTQPMYFTLLTCWFISMSFRRGCNNSHVQTHVRMHLRLQQLAFDKCSCCQNMRSSKKAHMRM